jgi:hypothetical protein
MGAVLGVSLLVAVLGTPSPADAVATFHEAYLLMAVLGALAAAVALGLGRVVARDVAPAPA